MESNMLYPVSRSASSHPLPFVGVIKAGYPTSGEDIHDSISLDEFLVTAPGFTYLLKVSGDSMINEGINPDDLVVIDKMRTPRNGDVVAACIDGEWTVKFFRQRNGKICLEPANPKYQPLYPAASLNIGGVVVSVIRKYY